MLRSLSKTLVCGSSSSSHDITSLNSSSKNASSRTRASTDTARSSSVTVHEKDENGGYLASAQHSFEINYPQYHSSILDDFRVHEFTRLGSTVYLDYTGASLYPERLIRSANHRLLSQVFGNPHSSNPASRLSSKYTASARRAVLDFFDADPEVYSVIWTPNATGAAKIIGESYPWQTNSELLLPSDAHNSINGLRKFAQTKGVKVRYYTLEMVMEMDIQLKLGSGRPGLFCLTGQSNLSGFQGNLASISQAALMGYHTVLDAAALAPTSSISLSGSLLNNSVDAMLISLYKIVGYPTGLGALVIKKSFLKLLQKQWFSGGTVEIVQVPGDIYTLEEGVARFEDGTVNFLSFVTIPESLSLISGLLKFLKPRILSLTHWTIHNLATIRHPSTGRPLVYVRSPSTDLSLEVLTKHYGATIAFEVADANGDFISCEEIEYAAGKAGICVRAGCMCNPGAAASVMDIDFIHHVTEGETKQSLEDKFGVRSRGVVRVSFGIASNFADAWHFIEFIRSLIDPSKLSSLNAEWRANRNRITHE